MTHHPVAQTAPSIADRMSARAPALAVLGPATHALLRIGAGLLYLQHGLQKLSGVLAGFGGTPGAAAPLFSLMGLAGVLEFVGGLLIIAGLFTRPVAFLLLAEMVGAFLIAHLPQGGWPIQNGGELPLLYAALFAFLVGNGAGPLSVDAQLGGARRAPTEIP